MRAGKIFFIILSIFILFSCVSTPQTGEPFTSETTICTWRYNKACAYTPTYDDVTIISNQKANQLHKTHNIYGTIFWNTKNARPEDWDKLKPILKDGFLDIGSHTVSHRSLRDLTPEEMWEEFEGSNATILENTGYTAQCLAYPFNETNDAAMKEVAKYYLGARQNGTGLNSKNTSNYYSITSYVNYTANTVAHLNSWIDGAIRKNSWLVVNNHGIDNEDSGWEPSPYSKMDAHYAYVNSKKDYVWSATMADVLKYLKERQRTEITIVSSSTSEIRITITDTLDDSIYNYPLTIKTIVPASWTKVKITTSEGTIKKDVINKNDAFYVYYEAIPDSGEIVIIPK